MTEPRALDRLWWGDELLVRAARISLFPLELGYAAAVRMRNLLYDRHLLPTIPPALPALSVGNVTVGGTGKTPVAAWLVQRLAERGARPAVVLRGYGEDEPLVHHHLAPRIPIVVSVDRLAGIRRAAQLHADVVVLDDAFQHRRAGRLADVVLVSADRFAPRQRLLPAGPLREPLDSLRRAALVVVTRKAATREDAEEVARALRRWAPTVSCAGMHLALGGLRAVDAEADGEAPLAGLAGRRVLVVAAVGDPRALIRQIAATGALVRFSIFPDHHRFTPEDAVRLASAADAGEMIVCTLKDAVKLRRFWPREAPPLWYVSQQVVPEFGADALDRIVADVLAARPASPSTAAPWRASPPL
ncbi:MAG TPA: tetraacyldisaccharide 4'-kinase [Gemmatimonadaceae bacterium]|nr:tetraacyldisaccharide 4'-kinase [Gemmatimonadaceae bacterium]